MSWLYAANIVGSAAGSLLTGYVLLDVWPLRLVALLLALFGLMLALFVILRSAPRGWVHWMAALAIIGAAGGLAWVHGAAYDGLFERLLYKRGFRPNARFAQLVENRAGVVAVSEQKEVFSGGVYDGMILTDPVEDRNWILRAYAIAGLHPRPRRILMIGMATGAWAQVLVHAPGVESLTVIEINPGFREIIAQYGAVASLLRNPKVRIIVDDGRRWLRRHPKGARFDAIVVNTSFRWRSHSTNLLSVEFLQLIRSRLAPGGIYYFNTTDSPHATKTAFSVFPYGLRFRNFVAVSESPISLDGARWADALTRWEIDDRPVLDVNRQADRALLTAIASDPRNPTGRGREVDGRESVLHEVQGARVITDDNMAAEWELLLPAVWLPRGGQP
jgi:spermidine synthase